MPHRYLDTLTTPAVRRAQERHGSREAMARHVARAETVTELGDAEREFLAAADSFYLATVGEGGWPYVQHRGGPAGFLRVLGPHTLGWAEFRGNRQYLSVGHLGASDKASLFVMDYPHRRRLKILGTVGVIDARDDPAAVAALAVPGHPATVESGLVVDVLGFDWNCPQHITPRFTSDDVVRLQEENDRLRRELARR